MDRQLSEDTEISRLRIGKEKLNSQTWNATEYGSLKSIALIFMMIQLQTEKGRVALSHDSNLEIP